MLSSAGRTALRRIDPEGAVISVVATTSLGFVTAFGLALLDDALFLLAVGAAAVASLVAYGAARLIAATRATRV